MSSCSLLVGSSEEARDPYGYQSSKVLVAGDMKAFEGEVPRLVELHDRVAARPNIKAYLASERRIPFNEEGIFRRYKELSDSTVVVVIAMLLLGGYVALFDLVLVNVVHFFTRLH